MPNATHGPAAQPVVYYVTAHGYGHGVRSCDILRALKADDPRRPLRIVSDLGEAFFRARLAGALTPADEIRRAAFDVGMVQTDSIRTDVDATLERLLALLARHRPLVETETAWLAGQRAAVVVADIPGLPLEAAARAGIPALAVGNFSWDWIYAPFMERDARWAMVVERFRDAYARADLLLRLPFHGDMSAFARAEDVPLLASAGTPRRADIARRCGADPAKPWVLLSFTSLDWDEAAIEQVNALRSHELFAVQPLHWPGARVHALVREEFAFQDVVASVDLVVSKPGFGIVSECIANRKPLVYADRSDFVEYPVLVEGIRRYLRHAHIPSARLYAGDLADALAQAAAAPEPLETIAAGGDRLAAARILSMGAR